MTESAAAAATKLEAGLECVQQLLDTHGFVRVGDESGTGSGGPFAAATFVKGARRLHLWLRYDSLAVIYRLGEQELDHATFMRELLGPGGPNRFPAYAHDARAAFSALRDDLADFCEDFLSGPGDDFRRCAALAAGDARLTGTQRQARIERRLRRD